MATNERPSSSNLASEADDSSVHDRPRSARSSSERLYHGEPSITHVEEETARLGSNFRSYFGYFWWFLTDQWFLVALALLISITSQFQVPLDQQNVKEVVVTYLCVALIFFITGCTLPTNVLVQNYRRWKLHLFCQIQSFLLTSAIVYAVVSLCAINTNFMDAGLLVGMIFAGCVPTTISSNVVMTKQASGNQALTVVESTLGNLLGPFISPLLLLMYTSSHAWYTHFLPGPGSGGFGELYRRVFQQLGLSLFLPLFVGQLVQNVLPNTTHKIFTQYKMSKIGSVALLIIIWQTFDKAFATEAFDSVQRSNMVFLVSMSVIFYILWTAICISLSHLWLEKTDTVAVAYIVPAKTPAMGVPLSNVMFPTLAPMSSSKLQIPMVIYQGLQIGAGSLLTLLFRRWIENGQEKKADSENNTVQQERRGSE